MTDDDGWTALHYYVRYGNIDRVTYYANKDIDITLKTNDGKNCLHIAALFGHLNLCKVLVGEHKFDVKMTDYDGWTALHFSARNGSYELFRYFIHIGIDINLKTNDGKNCLHIAAFYEHLNLCKTLINRHIFDVNSTDDDGWTVLHYSARNGNYELVRFLFDVVRGMYQKNNYDLNCLHIAALHGHFNLCKKLTDLHYFDVHTVDNDGWTALH